MSATVVAKAKKDRRSAINPDGSRKTIHPADVKGRFLRRRRTLYAVLIAIYIALPFVRINGKPAVFLDIANRNFYLFGQTFNAQDFWLVVFLLTTLGFSLLFFTAWLGRVWCGWACPQTVFLEGVYRRVERLFEGPRNQRLKLDDSPWTREKILRRGGKLFVFLLISLVLSHVFLSYFVSLPSLVQMIQDGPAAHPTAFAWMAAVTGLLMFDFAWFREQLCVVICPYGRLQSAMHDDHSLVIGYDAARGEPRGKLRRAERIALPQVDGAAVAEKRGDCIDCERCVMVCPTGIDIRDGLQMECIGCAQCIDACDEVMDKIGKPRGLIRYDSLAGLAGKPRRMARPRLFAYGALLCVAIGGLTISLINRTPFEANVLRVRGVPYVLEGDSIRNQYELHLINKNPHPTRLRVEVDSPVDAEFTLPTETITLESLQSYRLPVFVRVRKEDFQGPFELRFHVHDESTSRTKVTTGTFLGPNSNHARDAS
ncbi:MAG: cytochrome c oxidase accessory protein CcoG [Pseudomonadota bacterium]